MAASAAATIAQTPAKPATTAAKPATTAAKPAATADKLPPGVPPVKGIHKTLFTVSLRYQDVKVGDGAPAEPNKLLKYYFTLWLAADGRKIDSTDDHRAPVLDKDKKPVLDADGKPKLGDPQQATTIMGIGRPLPGWDMGFEGMKVGGKRRVFISWRLGLGAREIPARDANHPGIPAKSDLILDLELAEVTDVPPPTNHPGMGGMPGMRPMPGGMAPKPGTPGASATPSAPVAPKPAAPAAPATAPAPAAPAAPAAPTAPATTATPIQPQSH